MLEQLLHHIKEHQLCQRTDKVLLAVSGGVDSMVMLHLFFQAGFQVGVAHCNFQLRGAESENDELLVKATCQRQNIPFYTIRFDTLSYASQKGLSVQMAARELRYQFFEKIRQAHGYNLLATAHHHSDNLETVLLNLIRGTGLDGLTGIPIKNGAVIRPMLFATRADMVTYAKHEHLAWREDASNQSDDYHRNLLRNQIIPRLKDINPALEDTFKDTIERFQGGRGLAAAAVEQFKQDAVSVRGNDFYIDKAKLLAWITPAVTLWEVIKDFGFSYSQTKVMVKDHQPGKKFLTERYQLTIDRTHFIISEKDDLPPFFIWINEDVNYVRAAQQALAIHQVDRTRFTLLREPALAQLDASKLHFPLLWRSWQKGDSFRPLGMGQHKKLSDFFIDNRIPLPVKEKITVVESDGEIVWIVGHRIDDRFKITEATNRILVIRAEEISGSRT